MAPCKNVRLICCTIGTAVAAAVAVAVIAFAFASAAAPVVFVALIPCSCVDAPRMPSEVENATTSTTTTTATAGDKCHELVAGCNCDRLRELPPAVVAVAVCWFGLQLRSTELNRMMYDCRCCFCYSVVAATAH